jgi:RimJ/RimL family protein N-acetyltransferase
MEEIAARRLEFRDLPQRVAWFNDPSVSSQMMLRTPLSLADTEQWFHRSVLNTRRVDLVFTRRRSGEFASGEAVADEVVAMGGLTDIDPEHRHAELYIVTRPGFTGRGIGEQAVRWMCRHAFVDLGVNRIYLYTMGHNEGARRLYERLGFVHEGVLRRHVSHGGRFVDRHIQAILREEYERLALAGR